MTHAAVKLSSVTPEGPPGVVRAYFLAAMRASSTALKSASPKPSILAALYTSLAAAATGVLWETTSPSWMARRRSFCWCFRGKAVGYRRSAMAGPFRVNI
eukprot:EG_transcript_36873